MMPVKMLLLILLLLIGQNVAIDDDYIDDMMETGQAESLDPGLLESPQTTEAAPTKRSRPQVTEATPTKGPRPRQRPQPVLEEEMAPEWIALWTCVTGGSCGVLALVGRLLWVAYRSGRLGFAFADALWDQIQRFLALIRHGQIPAIIPLPPA